MSKMNAPPLGAPITIPESGLPTTGFATWINDLFTRIGSYDFSVANGNSKYIVATPDSSLPNSQPLSILPNGFAKVDSNGIVATQVQIDTPDIVPTGVSSGPIHLNGQHILTVNEAGQLTTANSASFINLDVFTYTYFGGF